MELHKYLKCFVSPLIKQPITIIESNFDSFDFFFASKINSKLPGTLVINMFSLEIPLWVRVSTSSF